MDYFRAQVNRAAERSVLQRQNQVLQGQLDAQGGFEGIIGANEEMRRVVQTARGQRTSFGLLIPPFVASGGGA